MIPTDPRLAHERIRTFHTRADHHRLVASLDPTPLHRRLRTRSGLVLARISTRLVDDPDQLRRILDRPAPGAAIGHGATGGLPLADAGC